MNIPAIYCLSTNEILYSRSGHDYRESSDKKCAIDGGFENYTRVIGDSKDYISIQLNGDVLLKHILVMDYNYQNSNVKDYPQGYCGRFKLLRNSNKTFYARLVKDFDKIEDILFPFPPLNK